MPPLVSEVKEEPPAARPPAGDMNAAEHPGGLILRGCLRAVAPTLISVRKGPQAFALERPRAEGRSSKCGRGELPR